MDDILLGFVPLAILYTPFALWALYLNRKAIAQSAKGLTLGGVISGIKDLVRILWALMLMALAGFLGWTLLVALWGPGFILVLQIAGGILLGAFVLAVIGQASR